MAADRTSSGFGGALREARERRGVSLRQIANATKIGMSALEALERNDISRLPGGIFSRAFVRSYAVEVGLDPEATIQDFIAKFPHDSVTAGHPTSTTQSEDHKAIDSDRQAATTFLRLIMVSVPIAGALLYFGTAGRRAAPPAQAGQPGVTAAAPVNTVTTAKTVETPTARVETLPAPVEPPAAARAVQPASAATVPSDRFTVALSATGECWVSATVDGEKKVERLLKPG